MSVIIFIIGCVLLLSCNSNNNDRGAITENKLQENSSYEQEIYEREKKLINSNLLNEIKSMITHQDSMIAMGRYDTKILGVLFNNEKGNCYVSIFTSHFYDSQKMKGYTLIDKYMVVFYNIENGCGHNLIDISRLEKKVNKNYPDESSDAVKYIIYEPWGRKYIIHSADSIELVYKGYF